MDDVVMAEPMEEANKCSPVGKRDASEQDEDHKEEHVVVKKRKISAEENDLTENGILKQTLELEETVASVVDEISDSGDVVTLVEDNVSNDDISVKQTNLIPTCNNAIKFRGEVADKNQGVIVINVQSGDTNTLQVTSKLIEESKVIASVNNLDVVIDKVGVEPRTDFNAPAVCVQSGGTNQDSEPRRVVETTENVDAEGQSGCKVSVNVNRDPETQNLVLGDGSEVAQEKENVTCCSDDVNMIDDASEAKQCDGGFITLSNGSQGEPAGETSKTNLDVMDCHDTPADDSVQLPNNEKNVGISEFVNPVGSLNGIIKQRYSDFIVNELNLAGQVVRLTTKEVPKEAACECPDVSSLLSDDICQHLEGLQNDKNLEKVSIPVDNLNKEERRKIHQFVRAKFSRLLSTTEDVDSQKFIVVTYGNKDQSRQGKNRKQTSWPPDRGNYTQFVLHKENIDTMDAINIISKYVKMNPASFTYSGTKDKRGITSQLVTVYRVVADKLGGLNRILRNVTLGNFEYVKTPLRLGDLSGNRFKIVLRKIDGDEDSISSCMKSLAEKGFINYFGMQRFGTTVIPTYHIGRALLRGNWKDAIELILKPREGDDSNLAECRKLWWETRDASVALAKLHRKNTIEGQLFYGLESHGPNDLVNAINCVPRNTRLMYTHSYQSYVWNRVVSRRLQKYQFNVIDGDLVAATAAETREQSVEKQPPRIYKASECELKPDITDIVLPLPGYDVIYPDNEIASWYREVMVADGLDIDNMKYKVQSYSLSGNYRRMLVKPIDVSWKVVKYDDVNVPLFNSDLDALNGKLEPTANQDGTFVALKLEFSLPPSSYATMALREIMKIDTSVAFQSTLK